MVWGREWLTTLHPKLRVSELKEQVECFFIRWDKLNKEKMQLPSPSVS